MFGSLGIEWNLLKASGPGSCAAQGDHRGPQRLRPLLHHGDVVRLDHPDPNVMVHGVVAPDQASAVFACTRLRSGPSLHTAPLRLRGSINPAHIGSSPLPVGVSTVGRARHQPEWVTAGIELTGSQLSSLGTQRPGPSARNLDSDPGERRRLSSRNSGLLIAERRRRSARRRGF